MKARAQINEEMIAKMPLEITFTMSVEEWRKLMRQMPSEWPASVLGIRISSVLGHVARSTAMTFGDPEQD